jgi:glycerate kinase
MRILVAPDKFKGSLSSHEAAAAISQGLAEGWPEADITTCPLADGGEGTMEVLVDATKGRVIPSDVTGPLGDKLEADLGLLGDGATAVVEMAAASGLELIPPEKRDPMITSTRGTGDLIRAALDMGVHSIIVGIGGSGTNDGGTGMAAALGVRFLDEKGRELPEGGGYLAELAEVDLSGLDPRIVETEIVVASDVTNPLLGEHGASRIYAAQKGADGKDLDNLENGLKRLAEVISEDLGLKLEEEPGAGAAGGLGYGLMAFTGAEVKPGVDVVMQWVGFQELLQECDLVITGEGKLDAQTAFGKTVTGVARAAKEMNIPVLALGGEVTDGAKELHGLGVSALLGISFGPIDLETSMREAAPLLKRCAREVSLLLRSFGVRPPHSA